MIHPSKAKFLGAGAMALAVHGLFALALVVNVNWNSVPQIPVYADLWQELPPMSPPPAPEPLVPVAPSEPAPPSPFVEPEINLEVQEAVKRRRQEAEQLEQERHRLQAEEAARREAERQRRSDEARKQREAEAARHAQEQERLREDQRRQEAQRQQELARSLEAQEQRRREEVRRELEAELARQMQEDLTRETRQLQRRAMSQAEMAARLQMIEEFQGRIRSKIHSYLVLPPNLSGNPEVIYQVRLLPDGEVLKLTLVKSSGQPAYDKQVERAILRASPLPLPPDRELAAAFREELILKFRPYETDGARS